MYAKGAVMNGNQENQKISVCARNAKAHIGIRLKFKKGALLMKDLMTTNEISIKTVEMTTVEISERTGKRHDHVKRDTELMLTNLYGKNSLPKFGGSYTAANGQTYDCYRLPKNEVLCLVSGYSIPLRTGRLSGIS